MLADLLSLPPQELDARLAECLEPKPKTWDGAELESPGRVWALDWDGSELYWVAPNYSDPSSPRSLIDGVEAEIERRGLSSKYVCGLVHLLASSGVAKMDELYAIASAPANIRVAAAVWAMEGKG